MRHWTTAGVAPQEQYAFWREVICDAYTLVDPISPERRSFESEVDLQRVGAITLTQSRSQPQMVRRGPAEIRRRPTDDYYVMIQLSGSQVVQQAGRETEVRPGQLVMIDGALPYQLDFRQFHFQCLAIAHDHLRPLLKSPEQVTAVSFGSNGGVAELLVAYAGSLRKTAATLPERALEAAAAHLTNLVAMTFAPRESDKHAESLAHGIQAAVEQYITAHLADPSLSVSQAARHFNVSPRTLQRQFETRGVSFTQTILEKRLQRAMQTIRRRERYPDISISEVAYSSGFNDLSYFCRTFRRRFGVSARAYRDAEFSAITPAVGAANSLLFGSSGTSAMGGAFGLDASQATIVAAPAHSSS